MTELNKKQTDMTLHEAIIYVLEGYGSVMSSAEIAQEIFDKKLSATRRFYGSSQTDKRSCKKISTAFYY